MAVIEINNLGPINHCRMDLEKFCVLTGPQASGKSTIAKAIFFFRTIKDDCLSLYSREKLSGAENGDLSHSLKKYLRGKFTADVWFQLEYEHGHVYVLSIW
ncbi:MAG: AAA family ATPase [Lachnospiraceae bacterium]